MNLEISLKISGTPERIVGLRSRLSFGIVFRYQDAKLYCSASLLVLNKTLNRARQSALSMTLSSQNRP